MASWKRFFTPVDQNLNNRLSQQGSQDVAKGSSGNFQSHLPQVYTGPTNRIERYAQYDHMDQDSHIAASLDIIAEFCTQLDDSTNLPFQLFFKDDPSTSQVDVLHNYLKKWVNINQFNKRLFDIVRGVIKYGDQFFIKDPETNEWLFVTPNNVDKITVDESQGKTPEFYWIRNLDYNQIALTATNPVSIQSGAFPSVPSATADTQARQYFSRTANTGYGSNSAFSNSPTSSAVYAEHVTHLSMNNGLDPNWPFGTSLLEKVFKTYKQKELLEDSIIIYRVQRAPERRIFYIDVGELPEQKAMQFVERMKNEIHQRRIPSKTGGSSSIMDAAYNPLSILEDFFFPQRPDGRGSRVETLPGGDTSWGIDELLYFDNKLARGLRVPSSYLPTGPEDSQSTFNDGRVGTALMQELRFAKFCERIQNALAEVFDQEFKLFLKNRDINISSNLFDLKFVPPQNYGVWRKIEIDQAKLNNFAAAAGSPFISKRYAMQEYLQWNEDQIQKNTKMWYEENPSKLKNNTLVNFVNSDSQPDLKDVGFNPVDFSDEELDTELNDTDIVDEPLDDILDTDIKTPDIDTGTPPAEPEV